MIHKLGITIKFLRNKFCHLEKNWSASLGKKNKNQILTPLYKMLLWALGPELYFEEQCLFKHKTPPAKTRKGFARNQQKITSPLTMHPKYCILFLFASYIFLRNFHKHKMNAGYYDYHRHLFLPFGAILLDANMKETCQVGFLLRRNS